MSAATQSAKSWFQKFPHLFRESSKEEVPGFTFSRLDEGLPRGALVEVSGAAGGGKTEVVLKFLAENPDARVAWVEEDFSVYPCAFPQNQVGLDRVLFVESVAEQTLWSVHQILRSQIFEIVVVRRRYGVSSIDDTALRRLQLAAEKAQVTVVLLTETPAKRGTWPIAVQLQIHRSIESASLQIDVLKYRGQKGWQIQVESLVSC